MELYTQENHYKLAEFCICLDTIAEYKILSNKIRLLEIKVYHYSKKKLIRKNK